MAKQVEPLRPNRRNESVDRQHVSIRGRELEGQFGHFDKSDNSIKGAEGQSEFALLSLSSLSRRIPSLSRRNFVAVRILSLSPTVSLSLSSILSLAGTTERETGPKRTVSFVRSRPTTFHRRNRRILPAVATGLKPVLSGIVPPSPATISVESCMVSNPLHLLKLSVR